MLDDVQCGIQRRELLGGGVELRAADVFGGVDDLALQVAGVDDVEVDQAEGADAGRGEVEGERRTEPAGADAEDFGGLELLLALHADFGQDEVARVAGEFVVGELREGDGFGGGGHGSSLRMLLRDSTVQVLPELHRNTRAGGALRLDGESPPAMEGMMDSVSEGRTELSSRWGR